MQETLEPTPADGRAGRRIGPIPVRTTAADVEAFRASIFGAGAAVPLTFPMRWLALPAIAAAVAELLQGADWVPVHEAQSFDYDRPLTMDENYVMTVDIEASPASPRLTLKASIATPRAELCVRVETVLRLIPFKQEGSPFRREASA